MKLKTDLFAFCYRLFLKRIFFRLDPELVHDGISNFGWCLGRCGFLRRLTSGFFKFEHPRLKQRLWGLNFLNPIGLSAGFDKNAKLVNILGSVGFGFMQVGTVTLKSYGGNPKPRLFRLPKSKALVVYYGLKNIGVKRIVKRLKNKRVSDLLIGVSVGKTNSKETANTKGGILDYYDCLKLVKESGVADFYTINVSCPNTFGGEPFTTPIKLDKLLSKLMSLKLKKPVLIKMPINLKWFAFKKLLDVCVKHNVAGVIIGNLNKDHKDVNVKDVIPSHVKGGVSGRPTWRLSNDLISKTYQSYGEKLVIVGVGGVFSADDAYEKIKRGASLVQLITGMIYEGPQLIGQINRGLVELLERDGFKSIGDAVGAYYRK